VDYKNDDDHHQLIESSSLSSLSSSSLFVIIKNEKIRVTLCENAAGALYIVNNNHIVWLSIYVPCLWAVFTTYETLLCTRLWSLSSWHRLSPTTLHPGFRSLPRRRLLETCLLCRTKHMTVNTQLWKVPTKRPAVAEKLLVAPYYMTGL